ncbi:acyl-CoA N-acyltransferase [Dendrothele bispora CBS 962.96]|uniref:Acyl-CoA N-acyltransferase n=1 Tax=Dendrothele bispora (strain CBS 962.96) TaxID=1314807 RepID=A0A4S8LBY1_DENBC|nr:acyl-CoA N-acyltransferase [Dendrothele bispora CBS 962.96]
MAFTTDRLRLRELRQSDKTQILALFNDYQVQESGGVDYTVPRGDQFFDRWSGWAKGCTLFSILETKDTDPSFIGFAALGMQYSRNRDAEFSIAIVRSEWSKGYGTEITKWMVDYAFKGLNMHRVSLNVSSINQKAIDLYQRS